MSLSIPFDNSYGRLPERFYTRQDPVPVAEPGLIAVNQKLAQELGLDFQALTSEPGVAALAGNARFDGADPLAQVYAGHQFGGWSPRLGDGRAILLGELIDNKGLRRDIQLKGSGRTPYSRGGDGRAWVGPVIREYIVSEAMHALGIPTTRALAAVTTGETVMRERPLPGAVLTRVASSHIRVGTFQYFASQRDTEALRALTDYVIARHYPDAGNALELLENVIALQARLIARWMGVGFIHGVMNTDNSHVAGETIDYGPCAFMDDFHPDKVFSSIDQFGRYAYGRQPEIAVWNMAQLATSLLPLIDEDIDKAVKLATDAVHRFPDIYREAWLKEFRAKIGLATEEDGDAALIEGLLGRMATLRVDFTNTFRGLSEGTARQQFSDPAAYDGWAEEWQARLAREPGDPIALMRATNPAVIPRNHRVEEAIQAATSEDYAPFFKLNAVLSKPFELSEADYAKPPQPEEVVHQTFCGT
ncbi:Selenoprotein O and cysteine-containing-like protein [Candidatus Rhodobacter oscarellae]|uniref:Protein nucleotidyltransferase YdiU n=1 Tax=Candidatus Rhodobacter oscarellae TaxID=1675527 RepID=A0A0J9E6Y2_9RHOB|nr:YdiU family protein [Candidatus Rhodobacter lobularis]KMW57569.1 Selenoprotein O and cysteine-containing-like protein [Candidatus Rhodobacter lobularis]